jgi:hypothetical protein
MFKQLIIAAALMTFPLASTAGVGLVHVIYPARAHAVAQSARTTQLKKWIESNPNAPLINETANCTYRAARVYGYGVSHSYAMYLARHPVPHYVRRSPQQQIAARCASMIHLQAFEVELQKQNKLGHCNEACRARIIDTIPIY